MVFLRTCIIFPWTKFGQKRTVFSQTAHSIEYNLKIEIVDESKLYLCIAQASSHQRQRIVGHKQYAPTSI